MLSSLATLQDMPKHTPMSERVQRATVLDPETGCLLWKASPRLKYIQVSWFNKSTLAHRLVWEETRGPIPDGMTVEHTCGRGRCMNVEHMTLLSRGDNVRAYYARFDTCKKGHPYEGRVTKEGWRICVICKAESHLARKEIN